MFKRPNNFGERHSRLAWLAVVLIVMTMVAFWTIVVITYDAPRTWSLSLGLYGLLLLCGFSFMMLAYHWNAADAYNPGSVASEQDLWRALESPGSTVVYLRNFSSEGGYVNISLPPSFRAPEPIGHFSRIPFWPITHSALESRLWETLHADAALFAIENSSSNTVPWFKTVRCSDDRWKEVVSRAVSEATLIILAIESETEGIKFEVDLVLRLAMAKTWVIVVSDAVQFVEMRWPTVLGNATLATIVPVARLRQASDHTFWPSRSELHAKFPALARHTLLEPNIPLNRDAVETSFPPGAEESRAAPIGQGSNRVFLQ